MPSNLTIQPTKPFKSSRLALPPSPFSPLFPLSPPPPPTQNSNTTSTTRHPSASSLPPPPSEPLNWLWQCHLCNRVYKLGTTRRCLEDGHYFCSGTTTVKRSRRGKNAGKKVLRHKACASEFDYAGWKAWGVWRRDVRGRMVVVDEEGEGSSGEEDVPRPLFSAVGGIDEGSWLSGLWGKKGKGKKDGDGSGAKDCWGTCDYPSECRWGKQYGVATPTLPPPPVPEKDTVRPKTKFEDILLTIPEIESVSETESEGDEDVTMQSPPLSPELPESLEEPTRKPSFDDLLESVKRRKRRSAGAVVDVPSPLASHPHSPTTISMAQAMDLAGSSGEHVEDVAGPPTTASQSGEITVDEAAGQTALQRAFDDFDLDFKKSFERAGAALTRFVSAVRSTAALEEQRAESFCEGAEDGFEEGNGERWT